jgi:protein gp37
VSKTKISWARFSEEDLLGESWNPVRGCSRVSPGCDRCYAERVASRACGPGQPYEGVATESGWTGKMGIVESKLDEPIRSQRPRVFYANSMTDLFAEQLPEEDIVRVFAAMAMGKQHRFVMLTKGAARMQRLLSDPAFALKVKVARRDFKRGQVPLTWTWPLPNLWLGVSIEDQQRADERVPALAKTPAARRFLSVEPLLGPIRLPPLEGIFWVIVGAETGHNARPMDLDWVRPLRDQVKGAGAHFFFKQITVDGTKIGEPELDGRQWIEIPVEARGG